MVKKGKNSYVGDREPTDKEEEDFILKVGVSNMMRGIADDIEKSKKRNAELDKEHIEMQKEMAELDKSYEIKKKLLAEKRAREAGLSTTTGSTEKESLDKGINEPPERSRSPSPEPPHKPRPSNKKSINVYKLSKTAEIKVPDKVIDVNNGRIKLVDTLDNKGDINKVDGHKVIDIVSYVPDSVKDSKIKVKQGSNSDISKEIKKLEGKIKRSKKPATIEKLNTELNNLLEKTKNI